MPPPDATIANISIFKKGLLGVTQEDHKRLRKCLAFAIDKILGGTLPLCQQDGDRLRSADVYLEEREPHLSVCEFSWGACAILSRALLNRRPRRRRGPVAASADAGTPGTARGTAAAPWGRTAKRPPSRRRRSNSWRSSS